MWKVIKRYPKYEINKEGDIRRRSTKKVLKQHLVNGHLKVSLSGSSECVSRLVAETYLRKRKKRNEVKHQNHNKQDNRVSNLIWANHKEIQEDIYQSGLQLKGGAMPPKKVKIVETGEIFSSIKSCGRALKISPNRIRKCLKNQEETARGYHFKTL